MISLIAALLGLAVFAITVVALDFAAVRWGAEARLPDIGRSLHEQWWQTPV